MESDLEATYGVVWPKSSRSVERRRLAPRLDQLDGKRVAFLWDHLFRGDEVFAAIEGELTARYRAVEIVGHEAFGNTHGSDEKAVVAGLPAELSRRHIDAVVSAMGC
jgi:hypothetical protein